MHLVVPPGGSHREVRRIELGPRVLTIGSDPKSDIYIDIPGVDVEHAKISEVALIAVAADCAVGDVPLEQGSRRLVMPGDELQIGSVVLALEGNDPSLLPPPPSNAGENMVLGRPRPRGPKVRVVEGQNFGDELVLEEENRLYVIGRAPKCDLVLSEDREVSREHVKLVRRGFNVYIQDQSSTRGSWLGRQSVYSGSTLEWTRPRMLKVGATVLALEFPEEARGRTPAPVASAPMTPPPRAKRSDAPPSASSPPPHASASGNDVPSSPTTPRMQAAPPHPAQAAPDTTGPPAPAPNALIPVAIPSSPPPGAGRGRKAWKKTGPVIGKGSGLLLLALAALTILGALFVVFSLME